MIRRFWPLLPLLIATGAAWALPLLGNKPQGLPRTDFAPASTEPSTGAPSGLNANEAARRAQAINGGGRVLAVEETGNGWRVKLLKDGTVRVVSVP